MQRTKWALALVMAVLGLLLMTQFRVVQNTPKAPTNLRAEDLANELNATKAKLKSAETERDRLSAVLKPGPVGAAPNSEAAQTQLLAGTVVAQGPGLSVTVTENTEAFPKARVSDDDLWRILNELLASGAEGLSVNGQRMTSVSGIRDVGGRVMIYQTMTNSPFQIAAIGDPMVMEAALRLRGGVVDLLSRYGIKVTIVRSDSVRLPAFALPGFQYAKAAK